MSEKQAGQSVNELNHLAVGLSLGLLLGLVLSSLALGLILGVAIGGLLDTWKE